MEDVDWSSAVGSVAAVEEQAPEVLPATPCREAKGPSEWPSLTEVICSALDSSRVKDVHFIRMGNAADFINKHRAYIEYFALKKGCVRKYEKLNRWVNVDTLTQSSPSAEEAAGTSASPRKSPRIEIRSRDGQRAQRPGIETEDDSTPQLAEHERGRKLSAKTKPRTGTGTAWGVGGTHKTEPTKVPLEKRVDAFPGQTLVVTKTPNGKKLFCRCCPKELENILGTIKTHINSNAHKEKLLIWMEKNRTDDAIREFLEQYFQEHPDEESASTPTEVHLYRWRVVEA
eukprot:5529923-Prymnesium_polylepis.1